MFEELRMAKLGRAVGDRGGFATVDRRTDGGAALLDEETVGAAGEHQAHEGEKRKGGYYGRA